MNYIISQLKKSLDKRQGFTLIELMIVVAIIAVLAAIGAAVYSNTQSRARDATRQSDIDALGDAMENARIAANSAVYPALAATGFAAGVIPSDPSGDADSYCVSHSQTVGNATAALPAAGANWPSTQACPTAPAAGGGNTAYVTVGAAVPPANTTAFRFCARLENSAAVVCKGNAQ